MQSRLCVTASRVLLVSAATLAIIACNDFAAAVRQVTYPPDFRYVSGEELRSRMNRLGYELQRLDDALVSDEFQQPQQQEVLGILRELEGIGASLRAGDAGASHPFLQDDMASFTNDVARARMAASLDPPRYYLAGRVAGACVNCHRVNR